jgi:hypothetical protein
MLDTEYEKQFVYEEITYKGTLFQAVPGSNGKYQVQRIISTDPAVFLCKEFQPGEWIDINHIEKESK